MNTPIESPQDRSRLEFVRSVQSVFRFLERDYGFQFETARQPSYVRYRGGSRVVAVSHGRGDYQIDVEVGVVVRRDGTEHDSLVSLFLLVGAVAPEIAESLNFESTTRESVRDNLLEAAKLLKRYGHAALQGEQLQLDQARAFGALVETRRAARDRAIWQRRKEAADAWARRDYETTYELLRNLGGALDTEEERRFQWIRSQRQSNRARVGLCRTSVAYWVRVDQTYRGSAFIALPRYV